MSDGNGLAEALLGLVGFRVLALTETDSEVVIDIETTVEIVVCGSCGSRAEPQDRMRVAIRDLACFGRPARLVRKRRRRRCTDADCDARIWTESVEHVSPRAVMTRRRAEACRQVGAKARPVSQVASELGACWWTSRRPSSSFRGRRRTAGTGYRGQGPTLGRVKLVPAEYRLHRLAPCSGSVAPVVEVTLRRHRSNECLPSSNASAGLSYGPTRRMLVSSARLTKPYQRSGSSW